ncbi:MAG: hypothetical protein RLY41_24, partial [Pseudomonadota bacterium]
FQREASVVAVLNDEFDESCSC